LEDDGAPALDKRVCFRDNFHDLCLELFLCLKQTVPQVVADGAFLEEVLECWFVFSEPHDTDNVRHRTPDEGRLEKRLVHRRVVHLEQRDIDVALGMRREIWCV
jgi:hypothetical protein